MLHRIYALIIKELLAALRDKKSRMLLITPPVIQLCIFAFAATLDVKNVSMGIMNLDNGKQSFELIQRFRGSPTFKHISTFEKVEEIAPYIDTQKGVLVLHIDEQFSRNLEQGLPATVQLILDGRKSNTAQVVAGYATTIINQFNAEFAERAGITLEPSLLIPRYWHNPNLLYYWYNLPCLCGILTMVVALSITALSVARERELGTFDQLLVSPLMPFEILVGKTIPAIILGIFEGTINISASIFIFGVPMTGSLLLLYFSILLFICSIVGFGLFISSLCMNQQQAILGNFVFISPAVLLSGFATPIENMPHWLQMITYVNPLRYFLIISKGVFLKAMPFEIAISYLWPLVILATINLAGASWFFRRRLE